MKSLIYRSSDSGNHRKSWHSCPGKTHKIQQDCLQCYAKNISLCGCCNCKRFQSWILPLLRFLVLHPYFYDVLIHSPSKSIGKVSKSVILRLENQLKYKTPLLQVIQSCIINLNYFIESLSIIKIKRITIVLIFH